ncbi:hypothetical protein AB0F07_38755 [Streptomyces fructofermentans]|uniref:hypothetical protein n=1 Tax=Streptomyces fructofermentans TaxID=152141 RepID=UPI0033C59D95
MEEFVFRQPRNHSEVKNVLFSAFNDPYRAYAFDGDQGWTVESVRGWWENRGDLQQWIRTVSQKLAHKTNATDRDLVSGLRENLAYIDGDLARDLRSYMYFLDNGESPKMGVILPNL